jgi:hypothetical protein
MRRVAVLLILLLAPAAAARADDARSLAFMGVNADGDVPVRHLHTLEETFLSALGAGGYFTHVTGRSDLATLLGFERARQAAGCSDNSCLVELAGALGVAYVSSAEVGLLGGTLLVHFKIIEVRTADVVARVQQKVLREEMLPDVVADVVAQAQRLVRDRDIRLGRVSGPPPLALAFVPLGVGQFANRSPVKGSLFAAGEVAAFGVFGVALSRFEAAKLPGSGGLFQGGKFADPAGAQSLQTTYMTAFWIGVGLVAVGLVDALVCRE